MGRLIPFLYCFFFCLFPFLQAKAESNILSDIARHTSPPSQKRGSKCDKITAFVNTDAVRRLNLTISCIQNPDSLILSLPGAAKITPSTLKSGALEPWLQKIYHAGLANNSGPILLFVGSKADLRTVAALQANPEKGHAGGFSDWTRIKKSDIFVLESENKGSEDEHLPVVTQQAGETHSRSTFHGFVEDLPPPPPLR